MFLFQANKQSDQSRCPPPPDGIPAQMWTYDRWLSERGMHPRDVDRLTRAELFWLPVIQEAKDDAARQLSRDE